MSYVYIIVNNDYNSLELGFKTRKAAEAYLECQDMKHTHSIIGVEMEG